MTNKKADITYEQPKEDIKWERRHKLTSISVCNSTILSSMPRFRVRVRVQVRIRARARARVGVRHTFDALKIPLNLSHGTKEKRKTELKTNTKIETKTNTTPGNTTQGNHHHRTTTRHDKTRHRLKTKDPT